MPSQQTQGRATSSPMLAGMLAQMISLGSIRQGLAFSPVTSDIIIASYSKSGTTLLQQIAHGLRSGGDMNFDEISTVSPWIEVAYDVGWDLQAQQAFWPRVYKSHLNWHQIPKGGRYICSFRDPTQVLVSLYRFLEDWLFESGAITLEELAAIHWPRQRLDKQGYWRHLSSWWERRDDPSVLLLCYEDYESRPAYHVDRIARFMGTEPDPALLELVTQQASRDFMLAYKQKFDDRHTRGICQQRFALPDSGASFKVTPGAPAHERYRLSAALQQDLDDIWHQWIEQKYSFKNYQEFLSVVRELP